MTNLAIKGHATRGREVIELLEMLGGENHEKCEGDNNQLWYHITTNKLIRFFTHAVSEKLVFYTLEEFLEKFPYKVGDKVRLDKWPCTITKMYWNGDNIIYYVKGTDFSKGVYTTELQPYKEETIEELRIDFPEGYGYAGIENKQVIFTKIEPQYPKTYERCCNILKYSGNYYISLATKIDDRLFEAFYKLKVCRDAYWKIAGEQMGLDNPLEPDWKDCTKPKYTIHLHSDGHIFWQDVSHTEYRWLSFPTKEMRDAFFENFKELIEECKELL